MTVFGLSAKVKPMPEQYIFTIENLTKAYAKREVLKNIWLAFYPGAKIGVIGSNGAGKSTLLRVMALAEPGNSVNPVSRSTDGHSHTVESQISNIEQEISNDEGKKTDPA